MNHQLAETYCLDILNRLRAILQPFGFRVEYGLDLFRRHATFRFRFRLGEQFLTNEQVVDRYELEMMRDGNRIVLHAKHMALSVLTGVAKQLEEAYQQSGQILPNPTIRTVYAYASLILTQEEEAAIILLREQTKRAKPDTHDNDQPRRIVFDKSNK